MLVLCQPMSSPMMTRILGFLACADAGDAAKTSVRITIVRGSVVSLFLYRIMTLLFVAVWFPSLLVLVDGPSPDRMAQGLKIRRTKAAHPKTITTTEAARAGVTRGGLRWFTSAKPRTVNR